METQKREMLPPRRVKILDSKYIEKSDLIQWDIQYLDDGSEQTYVWPSVDLLSVLNIKRAEVEIKDIHNFCNTINGKEINFVAEALPPVKLPEPNDKESEIIQQRIREHFDTFQKKVEEEI